ncbi:MAG: energy-coupling factor ABC transporter permease [Spirochaetaceae bacterium]|jgi:cobalt/nickel transport system permease protein|nr:energy-coupling factor ABC transporter permease [Spirochaetaceae bacterium]
MADALISPVMGLGAWVASAAAISVAASRIKDERLGDKTVALMGVSGAFVFAAQMINFTIPATGSSGHIGGGILLAGLLGPYPALLCIAAVLVIQCLFFADGGLLALGCNILNMGVIPCLAVYPLLFKGCLRRSVSAKTISLAAFLSTVVGLQLGAFGVVLETRASGITALPFSTFVALMQPIHLAIGVVEGIVTAAVLNFVYKARPEILETALHSTRLETVSIRKVVVGFILGTLVVGGLLSLFASSYPDGLEWALERAAGTAELEGEGAVFQAAQSIQETTAFMPDYAFADAEESAAGTAAAGLVGSVLTCLLAGLSAFVIYRLKKARRT